jgi:anti-sigma B factor antagonist
MDIKKRKSGDVTIFDLKGKLFYGDDIGVLREAINAAIQANEVKILLNFKDLRMLDSSGLGELVRTYTSLKKAGGLVKIVFLTSRVKELLFISKLITVFETFEDEGAALDSFT